MINLTNNSRLPNVFIINLCLYYLLNAFYHISVSNGVSCSSFDTSSECENSTLSACSWTDQCVCTSTVAQDIVILMDASGSLGEDAWEIEKDFVQELIETGIPEESRIALVRFSTHSEIMYSFDDSQNRKDIITVLAQIDYPKGYTYIRDAMEDGIYLYRLMERNETYFTDWNLTQLYSNADNDGNYTTPTTTIGTNSNTTSSSFNDRLMVLITDGNPVPLSQSPCNLTTRLSALG